MSSRSRPLAVVGLSLAILLSGTGSSWGATYKILYTFKGGSDGGGLYSGVVLDAKGDLYGGTYGGGTGAGVIYKVKHNVDGSWIKEIVRTLDFLNDGAYPNNGMVFDQAGNLYGTNEAGGPQLVGTVFQLVPNPSGEWALNVLYEVGSFTGFAIDPGGNLYGLALGAFELSPGPDGWTYKQIYDFSGQNDGGGFYAPMILDLKGNLYGTTFGGGNGQYCVGGSGCGTVFKLHPNDDGTWTGHVLHPFARFKYDGQYATGGVVRDTAGNLYGTTVQGGSHWTKRGQCDAGCGTIFKLSRQPDGRWKETILYNFPNNHDGLFPHAGPTLAADGTLYGTTAGGGDPVCNCGVVYKFSPNPDGTWTYTVLHRFHGYDGSRSGASLVMDKKGHLYGTTINGGPDGGRGVVFKVTP